MPALSADGKNLRGCIAQLSEEWAAVDLYGEDTAAKGARLSLQAVMPAGALPLEIDVAEVSADGRRAAGPLVWDSAKGRDTLANGLYSVDWHREFLHRHAYFLTPSDLFLACFGVKAAQRMEKGQWSAALYEGKNGKKRYGIFIAAQKDKDDASFIAFDNLGEGQRLKAVLLQPQQDESRIIEIAAQMPLSSLVTEGNDGAVPRRFAAKLVAYMAQ